MSTGEGKAEKQDSPPGATPPLQEHTRNRGGKGASPRPKPAKRAPPWKGGASTGEKEKREITVSCSSQFASGSTKARNYATAVLSRQPLANSLNLRDEITSS